MILETEEQVLSYYQQKQQQQEEILTRCAGRWRRMAYIRGGTFLLSLVPALLALNSAWGMTTGWFVLSGILFLMFLVVAYVHEGIQTDLQRARLLVNMHRESLARCHRQWTDIRVPKVEIPGSFLHVSTDLDLLGDSSLYKLLGITRTPLGTETLQHWIMEGAAPEEIQLRQSAVAELKPEFEWRLKFRLQCETLAAGQSGPSRFVEWAESESWFNGGRRWVLGLARLTSVVSLLSLAAWFFGIAPLVVAGPALLVACVINFGLSVWFAGTIHDVFNRISSRADEALHYVSLFDMVAEFPAESQKLKGLQIRLHSEEHDAQKSVRRLGSWAWLANLRRNGIAFVPYLFFEFLFFWDVHCLDRLEKWKQNHGQHVRGWFTDLAEWEALCALAKLAGDEPGWVFPEVHSISSDARSAIVCQQVGHPLLDQKRVCNDVQIGPAGTVLLVTGSNMSGKSTLLRSIGVNVVLAQMGSVVCASSMKLPPLHIETSMRIVDSLADGVSFFMAELKRLKEVVDTASKLSTDGQKVMLFLLDEILQGTNSRERQIAVSRVVKKLIDEQAIGAISTHDLDLATTDDLRVACRTVHFSEQFHDESGQRQMTFDYRMKSGIAETTNALKLLEMVGLGE